MLSLNDWQRRWGIPDGAIRELAGIPALDLEIDLEEAKKAAQRPEAIVQNAVRLEAARAGWHLWRNNVGALQDDTGRVVRYELANDSKALNAKLKSGDLIGWRSRLIVSDDVGKMIAQFVNRECKPASWKYSGTEREVAQLRWHSMILAAGGDSAITTGTGSIK